MKRIIVIALFVIGAFKSYAQEPAPKLYTLPSPFERYTHYLATARLMGATPLGSFADNYIDKASFQNYSLSIEWVLRNSPISVGGEIGSTYFEKRIPRALYQNGEEVLSAVQTRTVSQYPVEIFGNYHILPRNSSIQPYVQVSGGVSILDYTLFYGNLASQDQKVRPKYGIGVGSKFLFKRDGAFGLDVRVKYDGVSYKHEYIDKGISSVNGSIGLFYRWW
ncbi:hypothetical protein [Dyadobacter chenhuakuii]|uniref:Outer membrane protein with beta-barrel domain n=1 Tax=Dyadobacter chenhuakuii TaxID=2909339 RepID=A0ABY4XK62_9BACT|nr:hypothetical protein [Dyadobacter chenhuakuii]MCF2493704.1 hypothetical protein [Dyadobacter chenhuakuii]USJ30839.1 hypothetical protein NFI80_23645 [Dyadobacter chenhuakuii]